VSDPGDATDTDAVYPCVGICLPDADEAYCIGCGRPWGEPVVMPTKPGNDDDPAPTLAHAPAHRCAGLRLPSLRTADPAGF
jgi:Protein of unknown function (DUF1289)